MTFRCHTGCAINRPAESNANSLDIVLLDQPRRGGLNLLQNARRATPRVDVQVHQRGQLLSAAISYTELQLSTADFDA